MLYCNVCKERSSRSTTGWLPKRPGGCNVTVILTRETPASRIWQEGRRPVFLEDSIKLLHQPIPKTCRQGQFFLIICSITQCLLNSSSGIIVHILQLLPHMGRQSIHQVWMHVPRPVLQTDEGDDGQTRACSVLSLSLSLSFIAKTISKPICGPSWVSSWVHPWQT